MKKQDQVLFMNNMKEYNLLKQNSSYIKDLNRGTLNFNMFKEQMKIKYKERTSDKINKLIDNMDVVSSILDILK